MYMQKALGWRGLGGGGGGGQTLQNGRKVVSRYNKTILEKDPCVFAVDFHRKLIWEMLMRGKYKFLSE